MSKETKMSKDNKKKKPHYKKKPNGIYNKKLTRGKSRSKDKGGKIDHLIEELVVQAQHQVHVAEPSEEILVPIADAQGEAAEPIQGSDAQAEAPAAQETTQQPAQKKPMTPGSKLIMQVAMAGAFVCMGLILLLSTAFLVYYPMREQNEALAEERLASRMELSLLIADVFPSMKADDELNDMLLRALENRKNTLRKEGNTVIKEIGTLQSDEIIAGLLEETGYVGADFAGLPKDSVQTKALLDTLGIPIGAIDAQIEEMGVAKLKEGIALYKGTTTTVTKEDENGETITETVVTGGLVPEMQAKKNELQKKYDDMKAKLDALDAYIFDNRGKISGMYNRLENAPDVESDYTKMEAITAYVKAHAEDHMFLKDIEDKLASFPGESKEEDDILFMMKVESETGIRLQTLNYGQDYQHVKLSNGMLLCYEVYSIPYYATYPGLKNLIAYFNDNDDFYASVYTLSMQYNPANQSIQGTMVILHYYLLEQGAEYVPPVIDEVITPGIDGIFGDVTDNGLHGKQSNHTAEEVEQWLKDGATLLEVRDRIKAEGYPATELAWILKEKYKTSSEIQGFMTQYGGDVDYSKRENLESFFECDIFTLLEIYNYKEPVKPEDPEDPETPEDPENPENPENPEDPEQGEQPSSGKLSDYTVADIKGMMDGADGMSLADVRDKLKAEEYPAIELAWILHEEYQTESEVLAFMVEYGEVFLSLDEATEFFECTLEDLKEIYRS